MRTRFGMDHAARAETPRAPARNPLTRAEFAASFQQCAPRLWTVAHAVLGDRGLAEDALQDAALIALGKLESFTPGTRFDTWMATVVRYVSLNQLRKRRGLAELDERSVASAWGAEPEPRAATRGALDVDGQGFDDQVLAALGSLSPAARAALLLRSVHELEYRDVAALLGIPEGTAMSHVHRARTALRERLRNHPSAPTGPGGPS